MEKFEKKVWLSSPTMHGDEIKYVREAYETNWMSIGYAVCWYFELISKLCIRKIYAITLFI